MSDLNRRAFIVAAAGAAAAGCSSSFRNPGHDSKEEEDISPSEDLMREHGVLERVLLIYEEGLRNITVREKKQVAVAAIAGGAGIVRRFIEDYHERLEEDFLFPRLEKAGKQVELVQVLKAQHQAGRRLTDSTQHLATTARSIDTALRAQLRDVIAPFIRMYRPHAAREDTVLFPAMRQVVSAHEYDALGEEFEKREHQLFGEDGFERIVEEVAQLERQLGIADLQRFTPS